MLKLEDLTGNIFARLTVLKFNYSDKRRKKFWLCRCECGNEVVVRGDGLKCGSTKSCGCLQREKAVKIGENSKIHGRVGTKEYYCWYHMKSRCYNKNDKSYFRYGGRGIKVCKRWVNSFINFFEDMGESPTQKHSLDRFPNNNGNYEKNNCRWATKKQQSLNRRSNVIDIIDGLEMNRMDSFKYINIDPSMFYTKLKNGLTPQQINDNKKNSNNTNIYFR